MTGFPDEYELERFVQAHLGTFDHAYAELVDGRKRSHWMWFIFPQIEGLGSSLMAQRYAISSANEAAAYLHHPVLGPRLRSCVEAMLAHKSRSVSEILGYPDNLKFQSCMTLFKTVSENEPFFDRALACFFDGMEDTKTLIRLGR
jgi:uncharacterized protein (DUF1810 family)